MTHGNKREVVLEQRSNGCVECVSHVPSPNGRVYVHHNGSRVLLYKLLWEKTNGQVPRGFVIRHRCHNPSCVNLDHLTLGSQAANIKDKLGNGTWGKKLTWDDAQVIRQSDLPHKQLATRFGVSVSLIEKIKAGTCWNEKHRLEEL